MKEVPENLAKVFYSYVIDNSAVSKFCEEYNEGKLPTTEELNCMIEEGYAGRYDLKKHTSKGIPLGLAKKILDYLSGVASSQKRELSDTIQHDTEIQKLSKRTKPDGSQSLQYDCSDGEDCTEERIDFGEHRCAFDSLDL